MKTIRLFTLPGAGSSSIMYYKWIPLIEKHIRLSPLEIPGRGMKIKNKKSTNRNELINLLFEDIKFKLNEDEEYMILGNSFSSILALDLCRLIEMSNFKKPSHVFLAVEPPPKIFKKRVSMLHDPKRKKLIKKIFTEYFLEGLISHEEIKNLLSSFLEIVYKNKENFLNFSIDEVYCEIYGKNTVIDRNLYKALEFVCEHIKLFIEDEMIISQNEINSLPINIDLTVIGATHDELASKSELMEWREYTNSNFELFMITGDHLILFNNSKIVLDKINKQSKNILKNRGALL